MKNIYHINFLTRPLKFKPTENPMVSSEEMAVLLNLCVGNVLEIGTWKGITTNNILQTGCTVDSIDVNEVPTTFAEAQTAGECLPKDEIGAAILPELRHNCKLYTYNPNETNGLRKLMKSIDRKYDLIVVDGDHSYHGVSTDYKETLPYLANQGVMLFHDCWFDIKPYPVSGPMQLLEELGGLILNKTHFGMLVRHLERFCLV